MHAQLTELNGLKGSVGRRCIVMGLISSQVGFFKSDSVTCFVCQHVLALELSHGHAHAAL